LHFKWAKNFESAHASWPEGWENMPRLRRIDARKNPGERYEGPIPKSLEGIM